MQVAGASGCVVQEQLAVEGGSECVRVTAGVVCDICGALSPCP
jgi:hypothetical protein